MRSEKKNTGLTAGAMLIAILIIIQIGDSYCSELYDKIQSLFLRDLVMNPLNMSLEDATVMINSVAIPFHAISLMSPVFRGMVDYLGRKKVLLLNLLLYIPGLLLCMTTRKYIVFLIGNSLISLSTSVDIQYIYIASFIDEKKRATVRGILAAVAALSAASVPVIRRIAITGRPYDYTRMYGIGIAITAFVAVIVFIFLPWDKKQTTTEKITQLPTCGNKRNSALIYLYIVIFAWGAGTSGIKFYNEPMITMRFKTDYIINMILFIQPLITIIINIASGIMGDRLSRRKAICADVAATVVSLILFIVSKNYIITAAAYGIMIGAYFSAANIIMLMIMEASPKERIGRNFAWATVYNSVGNAIGMVLISILAKRIGTSAAKSVILIIPAVLTVTGIIIRPRKVS